MAGLSDILKRRQLAAQRPSFAKASLTARLGFTSVKVEGQAEAAVIRPGLRRPVVGPSADLDRILALPERERIGLLDFSGLKKPAGKCRCAEMGRPCCSELFEIQAQALSECSRTGGAVLGIGAGFGKELIFELLPLVVPDVKTAVLLISPDMRESFRLDWEYYGQHWLQPNLVGGSSFLPGFPRLKVMAYSELSHPNASEALASWDPDLIMMNEAHHMATLSSARTVRLLRFCAGRPRCKVVVGSGTLMSKSIKDCAHLSTLALGEGSPYPIDDVALAEWAAAIDPADLRGGKVEALMGALARMCRVGEDARAAFKRRRRVTPGVVDTEEAAIPNALNIHRREPPEIPWAVMDALATCRRMACRPDGEEFQDQSQVAKCLKELACGFYYRWIYPRGEPRELIDEWFAARQDWNREVRDLLQYPKPHLDSPGLAMRAAIRAELGKKGTAEKPAWKSRSFAAWRAVHKKVRPETEAVWLDDWLARDAAAWATEKPGIVWCSSRTFRRKVAELGKLVEYGGGSKASEEILRETGKRSIVASVKAHNKNKNLQMFCRNLVAQLPPDASMWEQLIARTHRRGQLADSVDVYIYLHAPEIERGLAKAVERARFVEQTSPNRQRLCLATWTFDARNVLGGKESKG